MSNSPKRGQRIVPPRLDSHLANPGVAPHGLCALGWELENQKKYGFESPRNHFVYGPSDITPYQVAKVWGLDPPLVCKWKRDDDWDEAKQAYLATRPAIEGGALVTVDLAARRERFVEEQLARHDKVRKKLDERMDALTEEINTALGPKEMQKTDASICRLIAALIDIDQESRVALGLNTKAAITNIDNRTQILTSEIVYQRPTTYSPHAALLAADDSIEAEVHDATPQ